MAVNYQLAVRQSILHKIAIYLQQDGSRDMTIPLNFNNGIADFLFNTTTYGIVPLEAGQTAFYPGVSILPLDEEDAVTGRSHLTKKRYILPVKIFVGKEISGNTRPQVVKAEVLEVCKLVLQCLSDGVVQIWDYSDLNNPVSTGIRATYGNTPYSFKDESVAVPGGDIRMGCVVQLNYIDLSL